MLYIMRHGKTDWNAVHKLQGRTDIPLNDEGRRMAENAAREYKDVHFDICFCSPLVRAKETAEILLRGRDVPIVTDPRLVEMSFGDCDGMEYGIGVTKGPLGVLFAHPERYDGSIGGAESLDELFARTGEFLEEKALPLVREGKDVLIVGHGAMNSSIVCRIRELPRADFWKAGIDNCKLMQLV